MKLVFDERALADLEGIYRLIAHDSPATAKTIVDRLFSSTELLISFPFMGHADGVLFGGFAGSRSPAEPSFCPKSA